MSSLSLDSHPPLIPHEEYEDHEEEEEEQEEAEHPHHQDINQSGADDINDDGTYHGDGVEEGVLSGDLLKLDLHPNVGGADGEADSGQTDYPIFKVGEVVSRTRGVAAAVKCDRTNGHVYIGSYTGEIILFDFNSQKEVWRRRVDLDGHGTTPQITCMDIRETLLAVGCSQGETFIYDLTTFTVQQVWSDHKQRVSAIAWVGSDSQQHVYTTSHDGYFLVRDASKKGKILHSFITCTCPLSALQVESPNIVYIGSWDGQVKKLDLDRKQVTLVMKANVTRESPIRCFALAPAPVNKKKKKGAAEEAPAFILFIAHGIGEIKSWDMRTGKVHVESYQGCNDVVNSMTTWNGKLYAAGDDRYVRMFDIDSGVCIESLSGHENGVTGVELCGVTPVVTPEMLEEAASQRTTSRKDKDRSASEPAQQGVGNELILTTGFDGQIRSYKVAAIEAAIQLKLLKIEEQKQISFDNFLASKTKPKKGGKGSKKSSRKGSAKAKSSGGAASATSTARSGSKKAGSKANSKPTTARTGSAASGSGSASAKKKKTKSGGDSGSTSKPASAAPKKKGSAKKAEKKKE